MPPKVYTVYQEFRGQVIELDTFDTEEEAEQYALNQYDDDDYGLANYFVKEITHATRTKESDR